MGDLDTLATIMRDAGTPIALSIVIVVFFLLLPSIIGRAQSFLAEYNRGRQQVSENENARQEAYYRNSQAAIERAIQIVTGSANDALRRMETMEKEIRDLRLESERDKRTIADQATEITALRAEVSALKLQLNEKAVKVGEDGSGKKTRTRRTAAAGSGL